MKTIYLTGTVSDMQLEYEAISSVVMPAINEFLKQYNEEAVLAGFTDTSNDEGCRKELKNCFRELKKGNAYFVSLFGEKHGDIAPNDVADGFLEKVGIHADESVMGKSVMEIEVLYAALSDTNKALFYFREPFTKKQLSGKEYKKYHAGFGEGKKVKKIKQAVKSKEGVEIHEYKLETEDGVPTVESAKLLANRIVEDLKIIIAADMNKEKKAAEKPVEKADENDIKIPVNSNLNGPINLNKAETPIWNSIQGGSTEKYNPEKLRDEAVAILKNASILEQSNPEEAGDLYDDAMEILRYLRKSAEEGGKFNDELDEVQAVLVTDECVRDMGLTYFAYARIEFNAKNFDGAAAWGKQSIESLTNYQRKYNKIQTILDLANVWTLMAAALANAGEPSEAIDAVSATMSCYDGLAHNKNYKPSEDFAQKYQSVAQLAHTICVNDKSGECAKKWLKFCQQQSYQLSKMGDNAAMINYVNFSMAICEYQIYKQGKKDNLMQYLNMIHEIAQLFLRERNEAMLKILIDKGRNLLEVEKDNEQVTDIVCSMLTLQANLFFGSGRHEEALANYTEVVDMRCVYKDSKDVNKKIVIAADYARRASAYTELNKLDEAKEGYEEAISILSGIRSDNEKACGELASAYMNYSVCLAKLGNKKESDESINKAFLLVDGKKLTQSGLILMRRRIRRMKAIAEDKNAIQMSDPRLMENAKAEMDKLREANELVKNNEFEKAAEMIENALENLRKLRVVDIVIPSEGYAANLAVCGSIYQDKLDNEIKGAGLLRKAWAVLAEMEQDGLKLNPQLVNNIKNRLKLK